MRQGREEKRLYEYEGAVLIFDRVAASNYRAQTRAASTAKAKSNITYQYKKAANVADHIPVKLTGEPVALQ